MNDKTVNKAEGGKILDDKGTKGEGSVVADTRPVEDHDEAHRLTEEQEQTFAADLEPGELGYLPIDDNGKATGPATTTRPEKGLYAEVVCKGAYRPTVLMTPAGAPIVEPINPAPASLKEQERNARREREADMQKSSDKAAKSGEAKK